MIEIDLVFKGIEYRFVDVEIEDSCPGDYHTPPYEGGVIGYQKVFTCLEPSEPIVNVTEMFGSLADPDEVLDQLNERAKELLEKDY